MGALLGRTITFDASKPVEASSQSFEDWLNENKPSKVLKKSGVSWISVRGKSSKPDLDTDTTALEEEWKASSKSRTNYDAIKALAVKHKFTSGKWLFHVETGEDADEAWRTVATEIIDNELNGTTTFAKISPHDPLQTTHVVCIYNKDFTDEKDVLDLEKAIRDAGIKHVLRYKPDIYTTCGIYANNARNFGLNKPVIFVSTFNERSGKSQIKNVILSPPRDRRRYNQLSDSDQGEIDEKMEAYGAASFVPYTMMEVINGWITYDAKAPTVDFKDWLDQTKPSQVSSQNGVSWICVRGKSNKPKSREDISGLSEEWKRISRARACVSFEAMKELAIKFNYTSGKWLFHVKTGAPADEVWRILATGIIDNELNGTSTVAKISAQNPSEKMHVVCVYNEDFTSEKDVVALENAIREAGIKYTLRYKPDIYTTCGIYATNARKFGLKKPVVFVSEYDVVTRKYKLEKY